MILYYNQPENEEDKGEILIDFNSIYSRVNNSYTESTLYRLLHMRCEPIRYQNRFLYRYLEVMDITEIYKEMKNNE
jgi:hypothetical protein